MKLLLILLICFQFNQSFSQSIIINELAASPTSFLDEDGDAKDWIELYNNSTDNKLLEGWSITDDKKKPKKWIFPSVNIAPNDFFVLFASGKNRNSSLHYHTLIKQGDSCKFVIPSIVTSTNWRDKDFDDSDWEDGITGLGFGDNDDNTIVPKTSTSIFLRQEFEINEVNQINEIIFHVDFDDGFAAYLNGLPIASANMESSVTNPPYNAKAVDLREAQLYTGKLAEKYVLKNIADLLVEGKNVLAVQVHNLSPSSDMSIIPFLSVRTTTPSIENSPPPILRLVEPFLHTNFKLKVSETLYLYDTLVHLQDSLFIPPLRNDLTVGRFPDGATNIKIFKKNTPDSPNASENFLGIIDKEVIFSELSGIFNNDLTIQLSGLEEGQQIHYTIDGSDPTLDGLKYNNAITVSQNTTIKAAIYQKNLLPSVISTHTYLIGISHELPVFSLAFEHNDFFDEQDGIYTFGDNYTNKHPYFGANFWKDIEKPIHLSYFEKNGEIAFEANAGVKIFGGFSRANAQRSLSIFFRGKYGVKSLEYPLFDNRNYTSFEAFVLRNSGNDWQNTMLRDLTLTSLMENSNVDIQAGRPIVAYLNGKYWGIYNLREKINEHYLSSLHDIPTEDITILERNGKVIFGKNDEYKSLINFIEQNDLAKEDNYQQVIKQIDLANYLEYLSAQIYFDNTDWPGNNIKFWKAKNGKWRWILFDTDFSFGLWNNTNSKHNTLDFALVDNGPSWPNPPWSTLLLRKLLTNTGFKNDFINTFADNINTRFLPDKIKEKIDTMSSLIRAEMPAQIKKWGRTNFNNWETKINSMKRFSERRQSIMRNHIQHTFNLPSQKRVRVIINTPDAGSVQLNSIRLTEKSWVGTYYQSVPITLTAIPNPGFVFDHWSGTSISTKKDITIDPDKAIALTAHFKINNAPIPENEIIFNEINYNSSKDKNAGDWVELYNVGEDNQDLSNWIFKDNKEEHFFVIPEGTQLAAKAYLVLTHDTQKFETQFPEIQNKIGDFDFKLSSNGEFIRLYDAENTLVDSVWFLPDNGWPLAANGEGPTLELITPTSDNTLPKNWVTFDYNGTPGTKNGDYTTPTFEVNTLDKYVTIAPNPFREKISLMIDLPIPSSIHIELLNLEGKLLKEIIKLPKYSTKTFNISVPNLSSGIYWLRVTLDNGQIVKRVIKM